MPMSKVFRIAKQTDSIKREHNLIFKYSVSKNPIIRCLSCGTDVATFHNDGLLVYSGSCLFVNGTMLKYEVEDWNA